HQIRNCTSICSCRRRPHQAHRSLRMRFKTGSEKFQFVPVVHRDSSYPEDDPNHSVNIDIIDKTSGQKVRQMHLFGDCDIETWGVGNVAITK
ncbi:hypothetical protein, partial [Sphingobium scionense]